MILISIKICAVVDPDIFQTNKNGGRRSSAYCRSCNFKLIEDVPENVITFVRDHEKFLHEYTDIFWKGTCTLCKQYFISIYNAKCRIGR